METREISEVCVIVLDEEPGIRQILLDRPATRNALNSAVVDGIANGLNGSDLRVIILASSRLESFSSGADLNLSAKERAMVSDRLYHLYAAMIDSPAIIIAAATGPAVGGGAQLLLAADLRFLSAGAAVRFMGAGHGLAVGAWGLPGLVGRGRALELCLSMRIVEGKEALEIGLADRLSEDPLSDAIEFARDLLRLDLNAVASLKKIARTGDREAMALERRLNAGWNGEITSSR